MDEEDWIRDPVELTARDAAAQLAAQVNWWIQQKGVRPEYSDTVLARHIAQYIQLRNTHMDSEITRRYTGCLVPEGWDRVKQLLWNEWLDDTFMEEEWETTVLDPVFGTLTWTWEPRGAWRSDLFYEMRAWVQRSSAIVALRDPRPPPPPPLTEEEQQSMVDPYLAEQEERRRRRG